jgi:hypothetical protein
MYSETSVSALSIMLFHNPEYQNLNAEFYKHIIQILYRVNSVEITRQKSDKIACVT